MDQQNRNQIVATGSTALSTAGSLTLADIDALPARLDDATLARLDETTNAPLPAMPAADEKFFASCMKSLATLPRKASDELGGELQYKLFERKFAHLPRPILSFMVETVLDEHDWYPSIKQCRDIIDRFQRTDEPVQVRARAEAIARRERQARFDETFAALERGDLDAAAIAALPERWIAIAETRGLIWRFSDGTFEPRPRHRPAAEASAGEPTGEDLADLCASLSSAAWRRAGARVDVGRPPQGQDFNDMAMEGA